MPGTISRGIRAPIISRGDDIVDIVVSSVLSTVELEGFELHDRDVICVTESVVARADGNYCTIDDIAADVRRKLPGTVGVVFPIFSRNRFAVCLKGIARGSKKVVVQMQFPTDEEGNRLIDDDVLMDSGINPFDILSDKEFKEAFGETKHIFTGVDYISLYREIIREEGAEAEIILSNDPGAIVKYADSYIAADIHEREKTKNRILKAGGKRVLTLCEIMNAPINGSGYHPEYGLLGSNRATEEEIKLFPKNAQDVAEKIQKAFLDKTGLHIESMVYGDGAFKDPVGKIWELADPVVAVGYTSGLAGIPNELKLKYLADNEFAGLSGEQLEKKIREKIRSKSRDLFGKMESQGTTPRRVRDLIGSLCDLTSGSGDKGTPIVLVQNYFSNYSD